MPPNEPMRPRDNPFTADRLEALPFRLPGGLTWDALLDRCAAAKWRGAIVGPHGSGKTTLLEQLLPRVRARGFTRIACLAGHMAEWLRAGHPVEK